MKIDRLISIIMLLLERERISIPELANLCEVSPRTVSRDLDTINLAGIPIVSYPGLHGGVGIMENYKLEKRLFSTADVTTLLMGLGCIRSSLSGSEVANALAKVKGMIPEEQRREIELKAGRLAIDMTPWVGNAKQTDTIEVIEQALEKSRLLQFSYTDRKGNASSRMVEPYRLLLKGMRWYLDGYCLKRQDYRLFKLSRVQELTMLDTLFSPREYMPDAIVQPNFRDENIVTVTLKVKGETAERMEELFGSEIFAGTEEEWRIAQIPLSNDERGYRYLLGFGTDCVCVEPEAVRKQMRRYLEQLTELY